MSHPLRLVAASLGMLVSAACLSVWPQPLVYSCAGAALSLDAATFAIEATGISSPLLTRAIQRYERIAFIPSPALLPLNGSVAGALTALHVNVLSSDTELGMNTNESYTLVVPPAGDSAVITAPTVFGALRGLETFSQIVAWNGPSSSSFVIGACSVADSPRFRYRSAMVDSSRHFVPVSTLYAFIDAMAYSKMNVLHWHVTDDQSFPFESSAFPALAARGAWGAGRPDGSGPQVALLHTYAVTDVQNVIAYAKDRGVRVIPEFDSPGHTLSWGLGLPGLLTPCYTNGLPDGTFGPIDPTQAATYDTVGALLGEVAAAFPDAYMHIGGDEVPYDCWASNPAIVLWMSAHGMAGNFTALESYYVQKVLAMVAAFNKSAIGWQEVFDNNLTLRADTVVSAWKGTTAEGLLELQRVTAAGHPAILTAGYYLNYGNYTSIGGVPDWVGFYETEPLAFNGSAAQYTLVLGGGFSMWGEYMDGVNLVSRAFTRGSAVAERFWSAADVRSVPAATPRLEAFRCLLLDRGIGAEVVYGPGYCPRPFGQAYSPPWASAAARLA